MALCRPLLLYAPLHRFPVSNPTFFFPEYPCYSCKFTNRRNPQTPFCRTCCSSSSMEAPPQGYRRNVGICLINSSKKIFSASRLDIPNAWQMPQGGIDDNEDPKVAALRELKEETGVSSAEVLAEAPYWLTYDFPPEVREKLKHQWGSDWKGQAQKCHHTTQLLISELRAVFLFCSELDLVGSRSNIEQKQLQRRFYSLFCNANMRLLALVPKVICPPTIVFQFLLKFTGKEEEINLLGDGTEKPEFGEWSWMTPEQIVELAVDFKKPVYKKVLEVFAPYLQ
ncbi:NUDIX hydrolase domain - like 3 [Theobroma cacao]|nr:NUDIX hydrolase domain - like 3 [Theobroma cacao]